MTAPATPDDFSMNHDLVDAWTPVHVLSGVCFGLLGVPPVYAAVAAVLYEVAEYAHEWPKGSVLFGSKRPESFSNIVSDLAVFGVGYAAGRAVDPMRGR